MNILKNLNKYLVIYSVILSVALFGFYRYQKKLKIENLAYRQNVTVLMDSVAHYQVNDSLNASQIGELQLKLSEYKKYRKEDIDDLKEKVLPEVSLPASFTDGYGVSPANGNLASNSAQAYSYSNYIDVSSCDNVTIGILDASSAYGYALYNQNYQYIRGGSGTGKTWSYLNTVINTQDAYYLRLTSVATTNSHFAEMGYPIVKAEASPLTKNVVVNNLETEDEGYVLDARQGKVLKDLIVNGMTLSNLLTSPYLGWWRFAEATLNSDSRYGTNAAFMDTDKDLYITADSGYELAGVYFSGGHCYGVDQDGNRQEVSAYYKSIIIKAGNKWNVQARKFSLSEITNINEFFSHFKVTYKKEEQDEEVKDTKEANPLFETFASYNAKNSNALSKEIIFSTSVDGGGESLRRIPSVIVTNAKTVIAATEARSAYADNAQTGIILARKTSGGSAWVYNLVLPYNADSYGKVMNPSFIVDRNGAHGTAGRIYLFFVAFAITSANNGYAYKCTTSEIDNMYIYSDDDGATWSSPVSTKSAWDTSDYIWMAVSPANGAIMDNGTFVFPCMGRFNNNWYSGVMYKTPSGSWTYSKRTLIVGDNESTVFVYDGDAYLNCRNERNGHIRTLYKLDMTTNDLVRVEYAYNPNIICQQSICKGIIGGNSTFFQTANDPLTYNMRNRLTAWVSKDGMKWARLIRVNDGTTYGYSVADCYDGKFVMVYENSGTISYIDFSPMATLIGNVYKQVLDKSIEERLHELVERFISN